MECLLKGQYTQKWKSCHHLLQTCMNVFVLNTKEDILKNERNRAVFFSYYWSQWCPKTAWLQTFFKISSFVFRTNTFIQVWSKWWQNFHFWVYCPFKCRQPALLAEAIYTNSAHQRVIGRVNTTTEEHLTTALVTQMIKRLSFTFYIYIYAFSRRFYPKRLTCIQVIHFYFFCLFVALILRRSSLFFSLFKFQITSEKHLFLIKIKEIIIKLKIKYWAGLGVPFVPIRWHPFNNFN